MNFINIDGMSEQHKKFYFEYDIQKLSRDRRGVMTANRFDKFSFDEARDRCDAENMLLRAFGEPEIDVEFHVANARKAWERARVQTLVESGVFPPKGEILVADSKVKLVDPELGIAVEFLVIEGKKLELRQDYQLMKYHDGVLCLVDNHDLSVIAFGEKDRVVKALKYVRCAERGVTESTMTYHEFVATVPDTYIDRESLINGIKFKLMDIEKNPGPGFNYYITEKLGGFVDRKFTPIIHYMVSTAAPLGSGDTVTYSQESLIADYLENFVLKERPTLLDGGRMFCFSEYNKAEIVLQVTNHDDSCINYSISTKDVTSTYGVCGRSTSYMVLDLNMPETVTVTSSGTIEFRIRFSFVSYPFDCVPDHGGHYALKNIGLKSPLLKNRVYETRPVMDGGRPSNYKRFKQDIKVLADTVFNVPLSDRIGSNGNKKPKGNNSSPGGNEKFQKVVKEHGVTITPGALLPGTGRVVGDERPQIVLGTKKKKGNKEHQGGVIPKKVDIKPMGKAEKVAYVPKKGIEGFKTKAKGIEVDHDPAAKRRAAPQSFSYSELYRVLTDGVGINKSQLDVKMLRKIYNGQTKFDTSAAAAKACVKEYRLKMYSDKITIPDET